MASTLTSDVGRTGFSPVEALMIAGSKIATETILARTPVGNSTLLSGGVKMLGAALVGIPLGKSMIGKAVATGLVIDGAEDVVRALLGGLGAGSGDNKVASIGGNTANVGSGLPSAI